MAHGARVRRRPRACAPDRILYELRGGNAAVNQSQKFSDVVAMGAGRRQAHSLSYGTRCCAGIGQRLRTLPMSLNCSRLLEAVDRRSDSTPIGALTC